MKKHYLIISAIILGLILATPAAIRADDGDDHDDDNRLIRTELRSQVKAQRVENKILKDRELKAIATSTRDIKTIPRDIKNVVKDTRSIFRKDIKSATSTTIRKELKTQMELRIFRLQHTRLVQQLELALTNLRQIRDRLASRITKAEQSGRTMTEAKALLVTADAKITLARQAVTNLAAYIPTATSTATTTATTTVDLLKPRQIGGTAIKAVKEAHKALVDVVRAIAKNMGFGNATTTPTRSPSPTATTTSQ